MSPFVLSLSKDHPIRVLAISSLASSLIYLTAFTLPYGLARGIEKPLQHFGHLSGPSVVGTLGFIISVTALFGLYLVAIALCRGLEASPATRSAARSVAFDDVGPRDRFRMGGASLSPALRVLYASAALSAVALLGMYPLFSLDVFYYMSADRIWTVFHENPFIVPPLQAAHDPFFPYTRWGHYPLPYGPLWPWISAATSHFGGGDLLATLLSFKVLGVLGYLACLPAVTWAAGGLHPARPLTATAIFALNPLVLVELAGSAHHEALAILPVILAVGFWARGSSAAAALALGVSLLVKATAVVVAPALLLASAQRASSTRRFPGWLLSHVVPAALMGVLAWVPFWQGGAMTSQFREAGQYYQSISALAATLFPPAGNPVPVRIVQIGLFLAFAGAYFCQRKTLAVEARPALTAIWDLTVFYFLVVTPFLSAWYMIWPLLYAAILAEPRITRLTTLLCAGALGTYVVQFVGRPALNLGVMETGALGLALIGLPFLGGLAWMKAGGRRQPAVAPVPVATPLETK